MFSQQPLQINDQTPLLDQPKRGFFNRLGRGITTLASTCWSGVKVIANAVQNPLIVALSAIGTAGVFYGAGTLVTSLAEPSLWLLAAPLTGAVGTVIVKYRPFNDAAARTFEKIDTVFDHGARIISRIGFHFLYFNRIANVITGGQEKTAAIIIVPITAVSTAVLGHWLNESLKDKTNPNSLLALLSALLVKPIDYGSALSPVFYVFGPDNAGLVNGNVLMFTELGLTGVGVINESIINRLSKKAKFIVDWVFDLFNGTSRIAYILSTAESLVALSNNDDVSLTQLTATSTTLIFSALPVDWIVTSRRRYVDYKELSGAEIDPAAKPVDIHDVTWGLPEFCRRQVAAPTLFSPSNNLVEVVEEEPVVTKTAEEMETPVAVSSSSK